MFMSVCVFKSFRDECFKIIYGSGWAVAALVDLKIQLFTISDPLNCNNFNFLCVEIKTRTNIVSSTLNGFEPTTLFLGLLQVYVVGVVGRGRGLLPPTTTKNNHLAECRM